MDTVKSALKPFLSVIGDILPRRCILCDSPLREWGGRVTGPDYCLPGRNPASFPISGLSGDHGMSSAGYILPGGIPLCPPCFSRLKPITGPRCTKCGKSLISEENLCMRCRGREGMTESVMPVFRYSGAAAELVSAYKGGGRKSLAPWFARLFAREIAGRWPEATVIPVPPRPEKAAGRAWDQVEAIAVCLARSGFPVSRCLCRTASAQQKKLGREDRKTNSRLAYHLKPAAEVPRSAVIIDDVFTTGATIEACSRLLRDGGAATVNALVIAAD